MSIEEIKTEREAQKAIYGTINDDKWTFADWAALVSHYATRSHVGDLRAIDAEKFRANMIKVGALALACVESIDRKLLNE